MCPKDHVQGAEWRHVALWNAWKQFGGLPGPGSLEEQDARLVDAFSVLDAESDMIAAYLQEESERRERSRR